MKIYDFSREMEFSLREENFDESKFVLIIIF